MDHMSLSTRSPDSSVRRIRSIVTEDIFETYIFQDAAISVTMGCATVFLDQSYWQRAIASNPKGTTKAYVMAGLTWFSVPFAFGSVMGLSARALETNPAFPTFPLPLSAAQQGAGLVAPAAAVALLGKSGAIAMLISSYMAVTSACSAQLISVSSIFTYDIYRARYFYIFFANVCTHSHRFQTYIRPKATAREMLKVAHIVVVAWGIWISLWSVILNAGSVDMHFVFCKFPRDPFFSDLRHTKLILDFYGTVVGAPVFPVMLTVLWPKLNRPAIFAGSIGGTGLAIMSWLLVSHYYYGSLSLKNLSSSYSSLTGSMVSLFGGGLITVVISLVKPDNYDFSGTRNSTYII